jgi:signal transduction histidine kinase
MLKLDPRKQLFVLLWLVAIHSIGVAFGLIFLPPEYLHYFGFADYSGRFFMMQSGVFHIVMSVAYLMAAYQFWCSTGLVYFAIITIAYVIRSLSNNYQYEREKVLEQSYNIELMREIEKRDHSNKINFFTNISHELRTPLSLIMAPLENLMENDNDETRFAQYKLINDNAQKLNHLVDQILDFRKLETGLMEINPERIDIVDFIRKLTTSFYPLAERNQINLVFTSNISKTYVNIDLEKVDRAISNILNNALKFTTHGDNIEVILSEIKGDQHNVQIEIKDTGIGIPEELTKNIFQPFYQSPDSFI